MNWFQDNILKNDFKWGFEEPTNIVNTKVDVQYRAYVAGERESERGWTKTNLSTCAGAVIPIKIVWYYKSGIIIHLIWLFSLKFSCFFSFTPPLLFCNWGYMVFEYTDSFYLFPKLPYNDLGHKRHMKL